MASHLETKLTPYLTLYAIANSCQGKSLKVETQDNNIFLNRKSFTVLVC